jgi:hypothetical protein
MTKGRLTDVGALQSESASSRLPEALIEVALQDLATWEREAVIIAASERRIVWHQPSRHEGPENPAEVTEEIFVGPEAPLERLPRADDEIKATQGGRDRGVILHKLLEEVLTRETAENVAALQARAAQLLAQLGLMDTQVAATGFSSIEMASTVHRALQLPDVAALRPRLQPEFRVYAGLQAGQNMSLTAGIAAALASDDNGRVEAFVDWKSDVDPTPGQIEIYRAQVRNYLAATGAQLGLVMFLTSNLVERISI